MKTVVDNEPTPPDALPDAALATDQDVAEQDVPDMRRRRLLLPLSGALHDAPTTQETPPVEEEPKAPHRVLADYLRGCSANDAVVDRRELLAPPYALTEEALDVLLMQIRAEEEGSDIVEIAQQDTCFYYSDRYMSHNYARILVFTHEQDACATLAQTVRFECETYPRPFKASMLALHPYRFDDDKIASTLHFLAQTEAYQDIHPVEASNGAIYLYSDRYMSVGKAQGLCEWIEVEQYENP